jgi:hypothetical protein
MTTSTSMMIGTAAIRRRFDPRNRKRYLIVDPNHHMAVNATPAGEIHGPSTTINNVA